MSAIARLPSLSGPHNVTPPLLQAAGLAGIERQTLPDTTIRYNAECTGLAGSPTTPTTTRRSGLLTLQEATARRERGYT